MMPLPVLSTSSKLYSEGLGYAHPSYVESYAIGQDVITLPCSQGYLLRRRIPGTAMYDAMGPYPVLVCKDYSRLRDDLTELSGRLVSLTCVPDPLTGPIDSILAREFDVCRPLSPHYIIDLQQPLRASVSEHHQRKARRSLKKIEVVRHSDPARFLAEWSRLYGNLIARKNIRGFRAFSDSCLMQQLSIPGARLYVASLEGEVVGADLYYLDGKQVYAHLSAYSPAGYRCGASYGMLWRALEEFADMARFVDLGGVPTTATSDSSGLAYFKQGWSSHVAPAYLCGMVLEPTNFRVLINGFDPLSTEYFPGYRKGEFE